MLYFDKKTKDNNTINIWKIEEPDDYFLKTIEFTEFDFYEFSKLENPKVVTNWLASRFLLKKMVNDINILNLAKSNIGKPYFLNNNKKFSISHSNKFIAIILSNTKNTAIDIEMINPKVDFLAKKFANQSELNIFNTTPLLTLLWSAKETVYKYCEIKKLSFKENIDITILDNSHLMAKILYQNENMEFTINYLYFADNMILTYF